MGHRTIVPAVALAAIGLATTSASAGVVGGNHTIEYMQIASGFIDIENPSSSTFTDFTTIHDPPVGSFLDLQATIPGTRSFVGGLDFISCDGVVSRFDFEFEAETVPFDASGLEFFFSGGRIDVTSSVEFRVTLQGLVGGSGGGLAFLYDYDDAAPHLFFPSSEPVDFGVTFAAGSHRIAWGALVDATGGDADLGGTLTFTFVPGPGAIALLGLATGALRGSRRRR